MASSPARPFASPLQRFPLQSSLSQGGGSSPLGSPSTSFAPATADGGLGADAPRLAQLGPDDQVTFSLFPLGPADVRWRCFQAVSGAKDDAVCALDDFRNAIACSWFNSGTVAAEDELEEGQESSPPSRHHLLNTSVLAVVVPFSSKAFAKPTQIVQPQPPQPSPESMGGPATSAPPAEVLTGKEEGGEVWVFDIRSAQTDSVSATLFDSLDERLPDGIKELSNGSFQVGDLFPALDLKTDSRSTSLASLLPTAHLRKIYPLFVQAARERMLAQLAITSAAGTDRGRAFRCGDSVILYTGAREEESDAGKTGREWGETWTTGVAAEPHRTVLRLTFALDLLPAPHNAFLFVPHIQRIPFFPLAYHSQLRHFSASPPAKPIAVRLLPHDTPAFYLRKSASTPSAVETARYWDAMAHTGIRRSPMDKDDWAICWVPAPDDVGMKSGSLVTWETQLILVGSMAAELPTETSPRPAITKLGPPPASHPSRSHLPATLQEASTSRSTALANGWRKLTSKSVRHFAPTLPSPPDSTEASSPSREVIFDEYEDLALSTSSYLDSVIRAREQEREGLEAEKERERRRKEGGAQTPPPTEPTGSPEGSDDLWGSPPATEPEEIRRPSGSTLHLPAVSVPTQPAVADSESMHVDAARPPPPPLPPPPAAPVFHPSAEAMDWSWDAPTGGASGGGLRTFGIDPLNGMPDEQSWGGPQQVTEDDFDFFDSAPLGAEVSHHSFADQPPVIHAPMDSIPPLVDNAAAAAIDTTSSFVDPSFSLSPMPTFVAQDGGESVEFTLSQLMKSDLTGTAPSPLDFATYNTEAPPGAGPTGLSPHPATTPSPASWLTNRTPKTPKTPFSPFVDVVEEESMENEPAPASLASVPGLVHLTKELTEPVKPTVSLAHFVPRSFQPIAFGSTHLEADKKYGVGKFSFATRRGAKEPRGILPYGRVKPGPTDFQRVGRLTFREFWARASTPEDDDLPASTLLLQPNSGRRDFRQLYDLESDPRIGVVERLEKHMKRRAIQDSNAKLSGLAPRRLVPRARDAAFTKSPPTDGADQSDDDDDDEGSVIRPDGPRSAVGGPDIDVHSQGRKDEVDPPVGRLLLAHLGTGVFPADFVPLPPTFSRPSYAPPSISTPMPLSALTPGPMTASTPAWAPTPTSPPFLGPSLKDFSRDAITSFTAWLLEEAAGSPNLPADILQVAAEELEPDHRYLSDPATADSVFKLGSGVLSALLDPSAGDSKKSAFTEVVRIPRKVKIAAGFQGKILKVAPEVLPFWSKIRLEPVGGRKDVAAFVVYESSGAGMNASVSHWLAALGATYEAQGLGRHIAGTMTGVHNGLVAVDPHQLAESLRPLLAQLGGIPHSVLYVLTPPNVLSSAFDLREVQQQLTEHLAPRSGQVLAQLVPYADVLDPAASSTAGKRLALAVYDRLTRKVERLVPRQIFGGETPAAVISFPAFHLARPEPPALEFQLKWPPPPLNLLDHHAFLHIGYGTSDDGDWLFGCAIDERGQAQEPFARRLDGSADSWTEAVVKEVLGQATAFAKRGAAEWRIVITRSGAPSADEVKAWDRALAAELALNSQALQLFVAFAESQAGHPFLIRPAGPSTKVPALAGPLAKAPAQTDSGLAPFLTDSTRTANILLPKSRLPLALDSQPPGRRSSPRSSPAGLRSLLPPPACVLPLATFSLVSSPGDLLPSGSRPASLAFHLLLVDATPSAAAPPTSDFSPLAKELAEDFHALALLTHHRWQTGLNDPIGRLPLHLAAVARMGQTYGALRALLS